ncbi:hypothetical protein MWU49_00790 [Alcanivorax sp. S6407]|uniref:hypothetical protein n=1 Tax=Alcanivorax sp. S6407 TaxID=2926424 RepID=UPI001FF4C28D|nr:hypothetical protein [Alcanivorax sp. S6407]MCK0152228.1 hypothetical protein [Alcanivorax sp. S6407]
MALLLGLIIDILVGGAVLYAAATVVRVDLTFKETVIAAVVAAGLAMIPVVGWLLSLIALFYVLYHFSLAAFPNLVLMVLVSRMFVIVLNVGLASALS